MGETKPEYGKQNKRTLSEKDVWATLEEGGKNNGTRGRTSVGNAWKERTK